MDDTRLKIALRFDPPGGTRLSGGSGPGTDAGDIEKLCDMLRDAGAAEATRALLGTPRPRWRSGEDSLPDVVATVTATAPVLSGVIAAVRRLLATMGTPRRAVELSINDQSIKVTGLSRENEDRLIAVFIEQVCGKQ